MCRGGRRAIALGVNVNSWSARATSRVRTTAAAFQPLFSFDVHLSFLLPPSQGDIRGFIRRLDEQQDLEEYELVKTHWARG